MGCPEPWAFPDRQPVLRVGRVARHQDQVNQARSSGNPQGVGFTPHVPRPQHREGQVQERFGAAAHQALLEFGELPLLPHHCGTQAQR